MGKKAAGFAIVFLVWAALMSPLLALEAFVDNWVWYAVIIGFVAVPAALFVWLMACVVRGMRR